jgi:WD40 repeat protein
VISVPEQLDADDAELAEIEEFERLGRRAGADVRTAAPEDGAVDIEHAVTRRLRAGAVTGGAVLVVVVVGALIFGARDDDDDKPPATVTPTTSTTTTTTTTLPPPAALELSGHDSLVQAIDVSPDGRFVVSAGDSEDSTIRFWDATTGDQLWVVSDAPAGTSTISDLAFSQDGGTIAVQHSDGTTTYLDAVAGRDGVAFTPPWEEVPVSTVPSGEVASPDGQTYVALERFTGARLVDATTDQTIRTLASSETAYTAAYSDDGEYVAVKFDDIVRVWRLDPFEEVASFDLPAYEATAERLQFTPDSTRIVYTVEDNVFIERIDTS